MTQVRLTRRGKLLIAAACVLLMAAGSGLTVLIGGLTGRADTSPSGILPAVEASAVPAEETGGQLQMADIADEAEETPLPSETPSAGAERQPLQVFFLPDDASLTAAMIQQLSSIVDVNSRFRLVGHSAAAYAEETPYLRETRMEISKARAQSVKQFLLEAGVAEQHIQMEYVGADQPLGDNSAEEGRAVNRRVDVFVTEQ